MNEVRKASRRDILRGIGLAGAAVLSGPPILAAAEPPPETTRLRLGKLPALCTAPQFVAEPLFQAEGFSDTQYVTRPGPTSWGMKALAAGEIDIAVNYGTNLILQVDAGDPVVIPGDPVLLLGGGHIGCIELFGGPRVSAIRDLKGKTVLVYSDPALVFLAIAMAHVGLDLRKDVTLVRRKPADAIGALEKGEVDAAVASPPVAQEMRDRRLGRVVVDTTKDRPWSQYFCCMMAGNREFVRKHPVAVKRAMRAIMKSTDLCALEPDQAARTLVDRGFATKYEYSAQTMRELPYRAWRDYSPEDTVRFYALRLHEAGMIKSSPQKILAQGADWRFLNELRKELKT